MAELIVTLKGRELQRVPIRKTLTVIGRDDGCDIVIDNRGISRQHAMVRYEGGGFAVVDAGSSNGVFVNGLSTQAQRLNDGDEIGIGKFVIRLDMRSGPGVETLTEAGDGAAPVRVTRQIQPTLALTPEEIQRLQASNKLPTPGAGYGAAPAARSAGPMGGRPDVRLRVRTAPVEASSSGTTVFVVGLLILLAGGLAWYFLRS